MHTWIGTDNNSSWGSVKNWANADPFRDGEDLEIGSNAVSAIAPACNTGKLTVKSDLAGGPIHVKDEFVWVGGRILSELNLEAGGTIHVHPGMSLQGRLISSEKVRVKGPGSLGISGATQLRLAAPLSLEGVDLQHIGGSTSHIICEGGLEVSEHCRLNGSGWSSIDIVMELMPTALLKVTGTLQIRANVYVILRACKTTGGGFLQVEEGSTLEIVQPEEWKTPPGRFHMTTHSTTLIQVGDPRDPNPSEPSS